MLKTGFILGSLLWFGIPDAAQAAKISMWSCVGKTMTASISAEIIPGAKAQHVLTIRDKETRQVMDQVKVKPVTLSRDSRQIFAAIFTSNYAPGTDRRQFTLEIKNVVLANGLSSALVIEGMGKKTTRQLQCVGTR